MEKAKKTYAAPEIKRVRLDVKTSVLGVCSTSLDQTPNVFGLCKVPEPGYCYN